VPEIDVDGEMQADTAVNPEMAAADFPFSNVAGKANVLVFPDLAAATSPTSSCASSAAPLRSARSSSAQEARERAALGAKVSDVVNMAAITVNQFLDLDTAASK
jgi:phosphotransacetylase